MKIYILYLKPSETKGRLRHTFSHTTANMVDARTWAESKMGIVIEVFLPDAFDELKDVVDGCAMKAFDGRIKETDSTLNEVM